jgi:hypothetical protein
MLDGSNESSYIRGPGTLIRRSTTIDQKLLRQKFIFVTLGPSLFIFHRFINRLTAVKYMYQIGKNIYMGKPQTWKKFAGGTFVINKVGRLLNRKILGMREKYMYILFLTC